LEWFIAITSKPSTNLEELLRPTENVVKLTDHPNRVNPKNAILNFQGPMEKNSFGVTMKA